MHFSKWLLILLISAVLCGCTGVASETLSGVEVFPSPLAGEITFDAEDCKSSFSENKAVSIALTGDSAACTSAHVEISGSTVSILKGGAYTVSGILNGMLIVHADKQDTVHIILSGVEIASPDSAALYVRSAGKVIISCAEGTENRLCNGGQYIDIDENNIDSVVFSKDDLTINGSGTLLIEAEAGHGVVSKDSLRITNANIFIKSAAHGLCAKDDIGIDGGSYTIESGKDGIHAENKDDAELGNALILGGEFNIVSGGDGISAGNILEISGGDFSVLSGGGNENASPRADDFMRFRSTQTTETENAASSKALKSGGSIYIGGGVYSIDSADDALHADADLFVNAGSIRISTGDDALHAENRLHVSGGDINIAACYEGLEALAIDVSGGKISLSSTDDGMNAAGGSDGSGMGQGFRADNPFASDPDAYIHISGGEIKILSQGDGIDSNGEIRISGGTTLVSGPTNGGNGSLDCGAGAYIEGGIFAAAGSSQMAEHFSDESAQCSLICYVDGAQGDSISIKNAAGEQIFGFTPDCDYQCIIISLPEFEKGERYTLSAGGNTVDITFESALFSDGSASGGMMDRGGKMQMPGQEGSFRNKRRPGNGFMPSDGSVPPEGMEMPDGFTPPDGVSFPGAPRS